MADRCAKCGEPLEDPFDACWRCGTERPGGARVESELAARVAAGEELAEAELQALNAELGKSIERAARGAAMTAGLVTPEQRQAAGFAHELGRVAEAFRRYGARAEHPSRGQRPDLDRRWTQLYMSIAVLVGAFAAMLLWAAGPWPVWLEDGVLCLYLTALSLFGICWYRAVQGEVGND